MSLPLRLRHLPLGITSYHKAGHLQEAITSRLLQLKAEASQSSTSTPSTSASPSPPPTTTFPDPILLTFEPSSPIYSLGRRDILSQSSEKQLAKGISQLRAPIISTKRGGQTTFHGPGQAVCYPILDLRKLKLSPKCHVDYMEGAIISLLHRSRIGIRTASRSSVNPGVWTDDDHKIAAVGVHLRRNISSHGVAINVSTDLSYFKDIVACGLETKTATSLWELGVWDVSVDEISLGFAEEFASRLKLELVTASEKEILDELQISLPPS